jgi:hypothetical protein
MKISSLPSITFMIMFSRCGATRWINIDCMRTPKFPVMNNLMIQFINAFDTWICQNLLKIIDESSICQMSSWIISPYQLISLKYAQNNQMSVVPFWPLIKDWHWLIILALGWHHWKGQKRGTAFWWYKFFIKILRLIVCMVKGSF